MPYSKALFQNSFSGAEGDLTRDNRLGDSRTFISKYIDGILKIDCDLTNVNVITVALSR
jgi:hypothetical protein